MRLGYVVSNFPPLSETFIRREVLALCDLGHTVFVYAHHLEIDPRVGRVVHPNLRVRGMPFLHAPDLLATAFVEDAIEHAHGTLMANPQFAAWRAAREAGVPFSITAYSGYTVFATNDADFYRELSDDPLCGGVVVEDEFMQEWVAARLGAAREKIVRIPNSIDLDAYRRRGNGSERGGGHILAIARFVEKKGLVHLVDAFRKIAPCHPGWELWLVGGGPEEPRLRDAAGADPSICFRGYLTEEECRAAYEESDIYCLPCVRTEDGDADGIPTTVLEAMAMELPAVISDLLSAPCYIRDGIEGLLTAPGDAGAVAVALDRLCGNAEERRRMGASGRRRVEEMCDLRRNVLRLEEVFLTARRRRWRERQRRIPRSDVHALASGFFQPAGRVLEIGCGDGELGGVLPYECEYFGCDPLPEAPAAGRFPFAAACAEALPFANATFDCVVLDGALANAFDPGRTLGEARRVLKPGGRLHVAETTGEAADRLNRLPRAHLLGEIGARFRIENQQADDGSACIVLNAVRPRDSETGPLVSVVITAYNRQRYLARALESALQQTWRPLEVVVVDDGSTDFTAALLERYRDRIRLVRHAERRGIAAAKNAGLRATSPEARYVAILDSDDYYEQEFIGGCVRFLEQHAETGLVYADSVYVDDFGRELARPPGIDPWSIEDWLRTCNLRGDAWVARRDAVIETDLHDERLPLDVDYDLFFQLLEITTFAHLGGVEVFHTMHGSRASRDELVMARCHAANLVKYGYSPEYAFLRARRNPEWVPAIEEGIEWGREMRADRERRRVEAERRLAVDGGRPVRRAFLPFGVPALGEEEIREVVATIRSGWIGTGPRVARFEEEFAAYVGARHAIALNSCTAGLFLALVARGVGRGDEVITTSLTFAATANVIEHVGARPVFADIDLDTLNLDPAAVERAITPRTRAILAVHFGGMPCDLAALHHIARARGIALIEDAAHAAGARYAGRRIGGHGNPAAFSFYANKNITTGEGGMLTTADDEEARRLRVLRLHGLSADAWSRFHDKRLRQPEVEEPGYKFNMPDLAAALGLPQLRRQESLLARREEIAARYDEAFADLPARAQRRPEPGAADRHSLHLYALLLEEGRWRVPRDRVVEALRAENIGATVHYRPVHDEPYYRRRYNVAPDSLPNTESAGRRILTLPISPAMPASDVESVIRAFRKVAGAYVAEPGGDK